MAHQVNQRHQANHQTICSCGHPLQPTNKYCPQCGTSARKACPSCGQIANPNHAFCSGCGKRLISKLPELRLRQDEMRRRIQQCDLKIAEIQDNAMLYTQYLQFLETRKGTNLLADATSSFIFKAACSHAVSTLINRQQNIENLLLEFGVRFNAQLAERAQLEIQWQELHYQIQEAVLLENQP